MKEPSQVQWMKAEHITHPIKKLRKENTKINVWLCCYSMHFYHSIPKKKASSEERENKSAE